MGYKDIINNIQPIEYSKYSKITSNEKLMLLVAYTLEKKNIPLTFNYLCVATFKMFPDVFCLDDEFKEFPSVDRLNRTYMHLKYVKNGTPCITGTQKNGFQLSQYGRNIAEQTNAIISNTKIDATIKAPVIDMHKSGSIQDYKKFIKSDLYIKFSTTKLCDINLVWKHFSVIPYTQLGKIKNQLNEVKKYAAEHDDSSCVELIKIIFERL